VAWSAVTKVGAGLSIDDRARLPVNPVAVVTGDARHLDDVALHRLERQKK
jgi:hypothetical protein